MYLNTRCIAQSFLKGLFHHRNTPYRFRACTVPDRISGRRYSGGCSHRNDSDR